MTAFQKTCPTIAKERDDLIALDGGIVRLPASIRLERARNVPNVMDVPLTRMISCLEIYGCFAETQSPSSSGGTPSSPRVLPSPEQPDHRRRRAHEIIFDASFPAWDSPFLASGT